VLPPELGDKYERLALRKALAKLPDLQVCPGHNCEYALEIDRSPSTVATLLQPLRALLHLPPAKCQVGRPTTAHGAVRITLG